MKATKFDTYDDILDAYEAQDGRAGYCFDNEGEVTRFWVLLPTGVMSRLNIGDNGWNVTLEPDGTVTVTPSIWNHSPPGEWHGFLTCDEFVSC